MLCTFGPPNERKKRFILRFEDADKADMHFDDEAEAVAMFRRCELNWTCTLFGTVDTAVAAERERCAKFVAAAEELRTWWLNDGHELREPSATYFREAKVRYDEALAAIRRGE
jgi:hypothetical protein